MYAAKMYVDNKYTLFSSYWPLACVCTLEEPQGDILNSVTCGRERKMLYVKSSRALKIDYLPDRKIPNCPKIFWTIIHFYLFL